MLLVMGHQLGEGPFLFQHECAPVHKVRSMKTWFGVKELKEPVQKYMFVMNWNAD